MTSKKARHSGSIQRLGQAGLAALNHNCSSLQCYYKVLTTRLEMPLVLGRRPLLLMVKL